jgi:tetratricopeptide (TPR) repeat protein
MHSVDLLLKALIENPGDKEISYAIALACLEDEAFLRNSQLGNDSPKGLKDRALTTVDRMLASHREDAEAWLIHYRVTSAIDRIAAESDIVQAMVLAPEDPEIVLEAGNHYLARARGAFGVTELEKKDEWLEKAEGYFRTCLEKNLRRDVQTYVGLGDTLWERSKKEEAVAVWENGIRIAIWKSPNCFLARWIACCESKAHWSIAGFKVTLKGLESNLGPVITYLNATMFLRRTYLNKSLQATWRWILETAQNCLRFWPDVTCVRVSLTVPQRTLKQQPI